MLFILSCKVNYLQCIQEYRRSSVNGGTNGHAHATTTTMKESIIPNKLHCREEKRERQQKSPRKEIDDDIVQFLYFLQLHFFLPFCSSLSLTPYRRNPFFLSLYSPSSTWPSRPFCFSPFALLVLGRNPNKTFTLTHSEC